MANDNNQGPIFSMTAEDDEGPILNFGWRRKKEKKAKKKRVPNSSDLFYKVDEIIAETQKLYKPLENEKILSAYKASVDATMDMYGADVKLYRGSVNIHTTYAKFTRLGVPKQDEINNDEWIYKAKNGRTLHVRSGHVSMDPEVFKTAGKATIWKRGTIEDAYNFALIARDDDSFHPPRKIRLNNLDREFQLKVQKALAQIAKECLPEGQSFIIANPVIGRAPRMKFENILHCPRDQIRDMVEVEENVGQQKAENRTKRKPADPSTDTGAAEEVIHEARLRNQPYAKQYSDLSAEDAQYNTVKNLLMKHSADYSGAEISVLTKDIEKLFSKEPVEPESIEKMIRHLVADKLIELDTTTDTHKISSVSGAPVKRDDTEYNKVAASMVHEPGKWVGKQRKDVSDFLFKKHTNLSKSQRATLTQVWDSLKADGIIKTDKAKITETKTAYAGTDVGADFIKAASKPERPFVEKVLSKIGDEIRVRGTQGVATAFKGAGKLAIRANEWIMDSATAYAQRIIDEDDKKKAATNTAQVSPIPTGPAAGVTAP